MEQSKNQILDSKSSLNQQALLMSAGTFSSRILGVVRESLFAAWFSREMTDAWYVAFRLPNLFRRLFGEGALAVSFVPIFVSTQRSGDDRIFFQSFFWIFSLAMLILSMVGILTMSSWLPLFLDPQYVLDPIKWSLTLRMARVMFFYVYLVCSYALIMAVLNTQGRFGLPALAPAFFNLTLIVSQILPDSGPWPSGTAVSWGVLVGGMVQIGCLIPTLISLGFIPKFRWVWHPQVITVFRRMLPAILGLGVVQVMALVNLRFASEIGTGVISYLNLSDRLIELPLSLVAVSIGTALLPALSRAVADRDWERAKNLALSQFQVALYWALPAAIILSILAEPIIFFLFHHGAFKSQEARLTAQILQIESLLVITSAMVRVFTPNFYAAQNTWYPAFSGFLGLVFHVLLAPIWISWLGAPGLALSMVLASGVNFLSLTIGYHLFLGRFPWGEVWAYLRRLMVPLIVCMMGCIWVPFIRQWENEGIFSRALGLFLGGVFSGLGYFWASIRLRVPEGLALEAKLRRRFQGKNPSELLPSKGRK